MKWLAVPTLVLTLCLACDEAPAVENPPTPPATRPAAGEPQALPTVEMRLGNLRFTLQVANDDAEREIGLMHVAEMPKKAGMIFVFPRTGYLSFWMKDTLIPLDILFLDGSGRVTQIAQMRPHDEETTDSIEPTQWVIELNAGMAAEAGIKVGDVVMIPQEARVEHAE